VERKRGRLKKGKPYKRENRSTNIQCNVCPWRPKAFAHHLHVSFHIFGSLRVRPKKGTGHKEVQTRNCCEVTVCHKAKRQKAFKMSWGRGFWVSSWTEPDNKVRSRPFLCLCPLDFQIISARRMFQCNYVGNTVWHNKYVPYSHYKSSSHNIDLIDKCPFTNSIDNLISR